MARATEPTVTTGNDTPTAPVQPTAQPETTAAQPVQRVVESGQPVEVSFVTGLPKTPATPAVATGEQAPPAIQPAKTFTQEQLDTIIATRLEAERKKFADYDDLKAKVQAAEEAQKTEAQKAADRMKELEMTNQRLTTERQELMAKTAIIGAASSIGLDVDAAVKLIDSKAIQVDDAGNATNAADLVKAVAERFPGLIKRGAPAVPVVNPSGATQPVGRTDDDRRREYFGGGTSAFWQSGGVVMPTNLE